MCIVKRSLHLPCGHFQHDKKIPCEITKERDSGKTNAPCEVDNEVIHLLRKCRACLRHGCLVPNCPNAQTFKNQSLLIRHMKEAHDLKAWDCPYFECATWESKGNRGFIMQSHKSRKSLKEHIARKHGDLFPDCTSDPHLQVPEWTTLEWDPLADTAPIGDLMPWEGEPTALSGSPSDAPDSSAESAGPALDSVFGIVPRPFYPFVENADLLPPNIDPRLASLNQHSAGSGTCAGGTGSTSDYESPRSQMNMVPVTMDPFAGCSFSIVEDEEP